PARGRPALGPGDTGLAARARPAGRQPAHRLPGGRDHGARLRSRRAAIGGPLRARRDGGRQRHVPAVLRAGGRGRTPGRERPRALARQHRLVPAPAAAPAARDVRFAGRARVVSDAPLAAPADAVDGPLLPGGSGRLAPGLRGAVAAGDRATRTHRRRARSPHAGAALPHALRSRGARDRQGSAGQAADLLLDLDGELRRPARPVALPRGGRPGAARGARAGRAGRQHPARGRAGLPERPARPRAGLRRVPGRADGGPPAAALLGGRAVAEQPVRVRLSVRHHRRRRARPRAGARGAGGRAARRHPSQYDIRPVTANRASMTDQRTTPSPLSPYAEAASPPERPPYLIAGLVALGALLLYVTTLAPTTQFWDTSEYIAAAYALGIPHPPGNPLFTLVAHTWGLIPWVPGYAERINLLAAVTSAIAAGCWFLIGERWMRGWVPARLPRRLAAVAGALVAATAFTVWNQSVVNEKVYTVSLLSIALVLWLIVRWDDQPPGEAHDHHLLLIVYLLALTATNHMMGVLVGPVVLILLFPPLKTQRPPDLASRRVEWSQFCVFAAVYAMIAALGLERTEPLVLAALLFAAALFYAVVYARNWDFALAVLAVALIGLSVYLFLPIRAVHFPPINEGEPTTRQALWEVLTRQQYGKPPVWQRPAPLVAQIFMWVQYFTWQWGR